MSDTEVKDAEFTEHRTTALATINPTGALMSPKDIKLQINQIQEMMQAAMQDGQHYGTIPGCGDKPTLLQPGAHKLALMFGFAPEYAITQTDLPAGHREYNVRCKLHHRATEQFIGEGVGVCSTMESKYRFRVAPKTLTGRAVPKEYWDARKTDPKKAQAMLGGPGYGTKKDDNGQWMITEGSNEKIEHDNPADYYNTIIKMAKKRAYVDAVLTATAASDIFTQDLEDMDLDTTPTPTPKAAPSTPAATKTTTPAAKTNPAPTTKPAPATPTTDANNGHAIVCIAEVKEIKVGKNKNGNEYVLWALIDNTGAQYRSFDTKHKELAESLVGHNAEIKWNVSEFRGNKQNDLTEISAAEDREPGQDDDEPQDAPQQPKEQTMEQVQFLSCERLEKDGQKLAIWRIETNKGRFGVQDEALAARVSTVVNNGNLYEVTYKSVKQGNLLIDYTESAADAHW